MRDEESEERTMKLDNTLPFFFCVFCIATLKDNCLTGARRVFWTAVCAVFIAVWALPAAAVSAILDLKSPLITDPEFFTVDSTLKIITLAKDGGDYFITGVTQDYRLKVASGITVNVTLNNATINVSNVYKACAFDVTNAILNLTLEGANALKSGKKMAGLQVPSG